MSFVARICDEYDKDCLLYLILISFFLTGRTRNFLEKDINNHLTTKTRQSWITSVCLGTAKLGCFSLHKWVFLFSILYAQAWYAQKENYAKKNKIKKNKMLLNMIVRVLLGDVRVMGCTSKVIVPIKQLWLCVSVFNFLIS